MLQVKREKKLCVTFYKCNQTDIVADVYVWQNRINHDLLAVVGMRAMNTKIRFEFQWCALLLLSLAQQQQPSPPSLPSPALPPPLVLCSFDGEIGFHAEHIEFTRDFHTRIYVMNEIWQWLCFFCGVFVDAVDLVVFSL